MSSRSATWLLASAALLLAACAPLGEHGPRGFGDESGPPPRLSLLAVGDTGAPGGWLRFRDGQVRVGDALAREDERRHADALLFLGDNFYPRGLQAFELEARVRTNLVQPYCHFAELSGPDSARIADDCTVAKSPALSVPLLAVLGNHDHGSPDSPRLQRQAVPRYVSNWRLADDPVERIELPHGVTLVLYDSTRLRRGGNLVPLTEALRAAQGEFRVLVTHHPLEDDEVSRAISNAIAAAGVPVQLLVAGHLHSLRVGVPGNTAPALQVVSGGGAETERSEHHVTGEKFLLASTGFARIDLIENAPEPRLRVTLYQVGGWPSLGRARAEPVAVWEVTRAGVASPYSGAGPGN